MTRPCSVPIGPVVIGGGGAVARGGPAVPASASPPVIDPGAGAMGDGMFELASPTPLELEQPTKANNAIRPLISIGALVKATAMPVPWGMPPPPKENRTSHAAHALHARA